MPKTKKVVLKAKKQKLTPEQRSQIAIDRWAKRRGVVAPQEAVMGVDTSIDNENPVVTIIPVAPQLEQPPAALESSAPADDLLDAVDRGSKLARVVLTTTHQLTLDDLPLKSASHLTSAAPKKQKRVPVPKEFSVALKIADQLLAKAIEEYEDCQQRITYLSGAIPRLQRTVFALRNESNPDAPARPPAAYDFSGGVPNAQAFQSPLQQQFPNPLAALQAAQPAPPVSRAQGGAIQFSPDVVGELEGPDDDNPDRFITGPHAGTGWIGS